MSGEMFGDRKSTDKLFNDCLTLLFLCFSVVLISYVFNNCVHVLLLWRIKICIIEEEKEEEEQQKQQAILIEFSLLRQWNT